jgi:hypothetical protein
LSRLISKDICINSTSISEASHFAEQVESALLHMDFFGGNVCRLAHEHPVSGGGYVEHKPIIQPLTEFFQAEGWEFSGAGYFSAVYVKGDLALKVGLKQEDSGATYAAWCRANQGLAGVPTIHRIEKFISCYLVLTDRCYPIEQEDRAKGTRLGSELRMVRDVIHGNGELHIEVAETITAAAIRQFFTGIATFDANSTNIMQDRTGNIIITDPVSFNRLPSLDDDDTGGSYDTYLTYETTYFLSNSLEEVTG